MRRVRVVRDGVPVGSSIAVAETWWSRLRGLLGRPALRPGEGLLLMDCSSVHTVGMSQTIDVAFLDAQGQIVRSISRLAPWRIGLGGERAVHTLELPAGSLEATGTAPGDRLSWS